MLSFAGRVELMKSTVSSLHIYWACSFLLPKTCISDIDRHIRCFLWGNFEIKKSMNTIAWNSVCLPAHLGGLGIKLVEDITGATLQRQIWILRASENLFGLIVSAKNTSKSARFGI